MIEIADQIMESSDIVNLGTVDLQAEQRSGLLTVKVSWDVSILLAMFWDFTVRLQLSQ